MTEIITVGLIMWCACGIGAIVAAYSDSVGADVYREHPVLNTIAFLTAGPLGLGMVIGVRSALKAFETTKHGAPHD